MKKLMIITLFSLCTLPLVAMDGASVQNEQLHILDICKRIHEDCNSIVQKVELDLERKGSWLAT